LVSKIPKHLHLIPIKNIITRITDTDTAFPSDHSSLYLQSSSSVQDLLELVEGHERHVRLQPGAEANTRSEVPLLESRASSLVVGSVKLCKLRETVGLYKRGLPKTNPSLQKVCFNILISVHDVLFIAHILSVQYIRLYF
jgi:hypothetical protein